MFFLLNYCITYFYFVFKIIVISSFLHFQPLIYKGSLGTYTYPNYANMIGWTISGLSMSFVPIFAIYKIIKTPGNLRSVSICKSKERNRIEDVKRDKAEQLIIFRWRKTRSSKSNIEHQCLPICWKLASIN